MATQATLVELKNVRFRYPGQVAYLFDSVSLKVTAGEVVMLAGPNGSGKSTLLSILSGRLPYLSGRVTVFGSDPRGADRLPSLGLITEPFHPEQSPLLVDLTGREVLTWLKILDGVTDAAIDRGSDGLGLARPLLNRPIRTLSKGERQRVMLLVVLLRCPRLILADEPLEGLDRESRSIIGRALADYAKKDSRSVLWVSHHLAETLQYADRLLEIEEGRLVERHSGRFEFRLFPADAASKSARAPSLLALPAFIEQHLHMADSVRFEVSDTGQGGGES